MALAIALAAPGSVGAFAQGAFNPAAASQNQNPVCARLEGQLASIDRGVIDPAQAAQLKRYEDAVNKQQAELDRTVAQSRRQGCQGFGLFSLFVGQPAQCSQLNTQIDQMRMNLDRIMNDYQRVQAASGTQESQRQAVLGTLAQNNCGPQYRAAANQQRGLFDSLFGASSTTFGGQDGGQSSTFRTLCVRTCDGYYYPISFATTPSRFREDEEICQKTCPAAEVALYSHRNPGEQMQQAVSLGGKLYTELPTAFRYRQEFNPVCSCRKPGQSWAEAMSQGKDTTVERGDIVVTEEKAKAMAQPKSEARSGKSDPRKVDATVAAPGAGSVPPRADAADNGAPGNAPLPPVDARSIRTVGPTPYPMR